LKKGIFGLLDYQIIPTKPKITPFHILLEEFDKKR